MTLLQAEFELIDTQRRDIAAQIETLSAPQRAWKRDASDWSALQIVEHLVIGDETVGSRDWARRQIEAMGAAPRAHPARLKFILWALRHNIRLPLPSPEFEPRGAASWPEIAARWDTARVALREYLQSPEFQLEARPFLHTIAGPLSARDLLELSQVHTAYHARQLQRLIASQPEL